MFSSGTRLFDTSESGDYACLRTRNLMNVAICDGEQSKPMLVNRDILCFSHDWTGESALEDASYAAVVEKQPNLVGELDRLSNAERQRGRLEPGLEEAASGSRAAARGGAEYFCAEPVETSTRWRSRTPCAHSRESSTWRSTAQQTPTGGSASARPSSDRWTSTSSPATPEPSFRRPSGPRTTSGSASCR